jgi:hypothetical protein
MAITFLRWELQRDSLSKIRPDPSYPPKIHMVRNIHNSLLFQSVGMLSGKKLGGNSHSKLMSCVCNYSIYKI